MHAKPLIAVAIALVLAGCGGSYASKADTDEKPDHKPVASLLVVDGTRRSGDDAGGPEPRRVIPSVLPRGPVMRALASAVPDDPWPAPALLANGTIDVSSETPFTDQPLEVQATPLEDDPDTTLAINSWTDRLRRIGTAEWNLRSDNGRNSPWTRSQDASMQNIVRIGVQRCGGARTVATGVVVAPETVVTTVHAIESTALHVRVSPALGDPMFIPAMVRYLDIDDDVAVLKVPGLQMQPIAIHVPDGTDPEWGYAYGVSHGKLAGMLERSPAVVAMQEAVVSIEQPDGFARPIRDRNVFPIVAAIDAGFSGGVVTATNGAGGADGWELHGLIRARMPFRALNAGIAVPARIVRDAVTASNALPTWFHHRPGGCPQWFR